MSQYINKSHNRSVLLYHYVCPAKYRRVIFDSKIDEILVQTCKEIAKRNEINVLELGTEGDYVNFLIQSVLTMSPTKIVRIIKSITEREIYRLYPDRKHANEKQIEKYVKNHVKNYERLYRGKLSFFE